MIRLEQHKKKIRRSHEIRVARFKQYQNYGSFPKWFIAQRLGISDPTATAKYQVTLRKNQPNRSFSMLSFGSR